MRPVRGFLMKGGQTLDGVVTWDGLIRSHEGRRQAELRREGPEERHSGKRDGATEAGMTRGPRKSRGHSKHHEEPRFDLQQEGGA